MGGKNLEYYLHASSESQAKISVWASLGQNVKIMDSSKGTKLTKLQSPLS